MRAGGRGSPSRRTPAPRAGRDAIALQATAHARVAPRRSTLQIDWSVNRWEERVRAAAVQLESTPDRERNLGAAERLARAAAADGARLVVLPERLDIRGSADDYARRAQPLEGGRAVEWARGLARELRIDLVAGSIAERREGRERVSNTSVHAGPDGELVAVYRKIHMFDVDVEDVAYRESEHSEAAGEIVVSQTADGTGLGLSIC